MGGPPGAHAGPLTLAGENIGCHSVAHSATVTMVMAGVENAVLKEARGVDSAVTVFERPLLVGDDATVGLALEGLRLGV